MNQASVPGHQLALLEEVLTFIDDSNGLSSMVSEDGEVKITQNSDGKIIRFLSGTLDEVLRRVDSDGKSFIQVNFGEGQKILLTDNLIGFKPSEILGLDLGRIPKVVTTPDLLSVLEAIEEQLSNEKPVEHEVELLKKVFQAILVGGERVGFDLTFERKWLGRLLPTKVRASA